jgi:hypothetical protein
MRNATVTLTRRHIECCCLFPKIRRWRARICSDTSFLPPVLEYDSKLNLSESLSSLSPTMRPLKRAHALLKVFLTRARKSLNILLFDPFSNTNVVNSMS